MQGPTLDSDGDPIIVIGSFGYDANGIYIKRPDAEHIVRWDPVRVLAEVEAKRQIIDWCEGAIEAGEISPNSTWNDDAAGAEVGQIVLHLMAIPHAGHEDYSPTWSQGL